MDGPNIRLFPRTSFMCPVEVRGGGKRLRLRQARGNLSLQGLCLQADGFPVNTPVRVSIKCARPLELQGVVRYCDGNGLGIEFQELSSAQQQRICELIAEFVPREVLAA